MFMAVKIITGRPFLSCPSIDVLRLSLTMKMMIMMVMIISMSGLQKVVHPGGRARGRGGRAASQAGQRSRQHGVEVSADAA